MYQGCECSGALNMLLVLDILLNMSGEDRVPNMPE